MTQRAQNTTNIVEEVQTIVNENKEKMVEIETTLQENKDNLKKLLSLGFKFLIENKEMIETHKQMQQEISTLKATVSENKGLIKTNTEKDEANFNFKILSGKLAWTVKSKPI